MATKKQSAGILLYRFISGNIEVMLVHPGGPFWRNKDLAAWSIPKGEFTEEEKPLAAAKREMEEETGIKCDGNFIALTPVKQKSGKVVYPFALEMEVDVSSIKSNIFSIEWPPKSGRQQSFPEADKAAWFTLPEARQKINAYQAPMIDELELQLK